MHGIVGGTVEQFGHIDGHEVVDGGQLPLRQPLQRPQGRLDAGLGAHDVGDHLFALLGRQIQGE